MITYEDFTLGVIFDEVTGSVATPPQPPAPQREPDGEEPPTPCEERRWQQQLESFLRRRERLEAD
jgi:hypothetical protein